MPSRLTLTFPGDSVRGSKDITFVCDSGDYDPGIDLELAQLQVLRGLSLQDFGEVTAVLELEDV